MAYKAILVICQYGRKCQTLELEASTYDELDDLIEKVKVKNQSSTIKIRSKTNAE